MIACCTVAKTCKVCIKIGNYEKLAKMKLTKSAGGSHATAEVIINLRAERYSTASMLNEYSGEGRDDDDEQ